jgi:hypothetical protein
VFEVAILDSFSSRLVQPQRVHKEGLSRKGRIELGRKGSVPLFSLASVFPFVPFTVAKDTECPVKITRIPTVENVRKAQSSGND